MAKKPTKPTDDVQKTIEDTHNLGVPSADDEGKHEHKHSIKETVKSLFHMDKSEKKLPKHEIKHHAKFAKFKGRQ